MSNLSTSKVFDVSGFVVLVTGGGTGIGLMMAKGFAANGAKVYIGGRRKEVVEKVAAESASDAGPGKIVAISLDVTDKESIESAVKTISESDGKLDLLVNNAGQSGPRSGFFSDPSTPERKDTQTLGTALFKAESFKEWADLYTVNVSSVFFVSTAFLGLLEAATKAREASSGGWSASIINITSISGQMKLAQDHFAYNSSKAAGNHLTKMFSTELALRGIPIRVNAIAPGPFPTEMTSAEGTTFSGEEATKLSRSLIPLPSARGGLAIDIVGAALYLASPAAYYVNGQIITVDGGYIATNPSVV
ncbi:NAD(P)-binding protein [Ceratobasidium sp. AG-I]|nr:NAD(P)-binding protein [Ceratobasidium sp. AG-I]